VQHARSAPHTEAMARWLEKQQREQSGNTIVKQIVSDQVESNRYYVKCITEIIQFLVVNELPLRGDTEMFDGKSSGLFHNLFMYAAGKDQRLKQLLLNSRQCSVYFTTNT
jgi:hypothetical protein